MTKPAGKKPEESISIRRQKAKMNGKCRICTVAPPAKDKEICKGCEARRAKYRR